MTLQGSRTELLCTMTMNQSRSLYRVPAGLHIKSRKSRYQSDESFDQELKACEAIKGHTATVKPKGNSMTQEHYIICTYVHIEVHT